MTRGLLIVDVQNDFCEGGALGVAGGNQVAEDVANLLAWYGRSVYTEVFASQDWHDPLPSTNGGHFAAEGEAPDYVTTWPQHCVSGTRGAELHPVLATALKEIRRSDFAPIQKGQGKPDYSAFQGRNPFGLKSLAWELDQRGVTALDVVGIATDHCVRASALDALSLDLTGTLRLNEVRVLTDHIAGVDDAASQKALDEIVGLGGRLITVRDL